MKVFKRWMIEKEANKSEKLKLAKEGMQENGQKSSEIAY